MANLESKPIYLMAGGRRGNRHDVDPILETVIKKIGKPAPSIAYVGAANGDSTDFFKWMAHYLQKAGGGEIRLAPTVGENIDYEKTNRILSSADGIFISGGDVEAGMVQLGEKGLMSLLRGFYLRGIPFFGSSAGSIMLANCWIRWKNPTDETTAEIFNCLGFADVICDTHGEADGWEELHSLLKLKGQEQMGYGIPTGLALLVYPDGAVEAIGGAVQRFVFRNGEIQTLPDLLPFP